MKNLKFVLAAAALLILSLWLRPSIAHADTFTVSLAANSVVTMGEVSTVFSFTVTNELASTNNITYVEFNFDVTVYNTSDTSVPPPNWIMPVNVFPPQRLGFITTTDPILPGGSRTFEVVVNGPGGANISSAGSDQTDTVFLQVSLNYTSILGIVIGPQAPLHTLSGSFPTWERKALATSLSATPSTVGGGDTITLSQTVTNRSTGALNNVAPGSTPTISTTGSAGANYVSGPTPPSVASLASGDTTVFNWTYSAIAAGTVGFSNSATDGATTSTSVTSSSNIIEIGDFTATLALTPSTIVNGGTVMITMSVQNNGLTSLSNITPSTLAFNTVSSATHSITSGPTPASIASLSPGGGGTFDWQATISGGSDGDTFDFSGSAASTTLSTNLATSNGGEIVPDIFTVSLPANSMVTMGDGSGVLSFTVTNSANSSNSISYIGFQFDNSIYTPSDSSVAPSNWSIPSDLLTGGRIAFITSTDPILPGGSRLFDVVVVGPGGANITSSASDRSDSLTGMDVSQGFNSIFGIILGPQTPLFTLGSSFPTWERKALASSLYLSPTTVGGGGTISLTQSVTNRSTGTLSNIVPGSPTISTTGTAGANNISGPTPPSVASLASGDTAVFDWTYSAVASGTVGFTNSATDGATSSTSVSSSSDIIEVGDFTASLSMSPSTIVSGQTVTLTMWVMNNGLTSLGNIAPSTLAFSTNGSATHSITSGPTPTNISSLAPSTGGMFEWQATVFGGSTGDTFDFSASAASTTLSTNLATSNQGDLSSFSATVSPVTISSASTNATLTFQVVNTGDFPLQQVRIVTPSAPAGFVYQGASGGSATPNWTVTTTGAPPTISPGYVQFSSPGSIDDIPTGGGIGTFNVTYTTIPTVVSDTDATLVLTLFERAGNPFELFFPIGTLNATVLITGFDISVIATPSSGIPADGINGSSIEATLTNGGAPGVGKTVNFSTTNGTLSAITAITDGAGKATVTLTSPTSTVNTSAVVTATYLAALGTVNVNFTGVTSPNLVYVGGSLSPLSVERGTTAVSFSLRANNTGGAGVTLSTASTFSFTDGTTNYISNLSSPTLLNAGASNITLTFDPVDVDSAFSVGSFSPTTSLTDGATYNQNVPVVDNVNVTAPNMIVSASVDNSNALPGASVAYTITYTNSGSASGQNINVIEMLRNKKREGRVPQLNFFRLGKFEMKVP